MAELQWSNGDIVAQPLTVVVGNRLPLKLIPAKGEKLPFDVSLLMTYFATVEDVANRMQANFTTFRLKGVAPGVSLLTASSAGKPVLQPVPILVQARIALPDAAGNAGLLTRLFLAEAPNPVNSKTQGKDISEAMTLMRVVVENRLAKPSGRWGSGGAVTMTDVVSAPGQFDGFGSYPKLAGHIESNIQNLLDIANDASDPRQPKIRAHVAMAIAVASGKKPQDPSKNGLYWWRTSGSGSPGTGVTQYKTIGNNTFWMEGK